ncbi:hypothetical protein C27AD_08331 [Salinisphaera hydrothermalis C27AD]
MLSPPAEGKTQDLTPSLTSIVDTANAQAQLPPEQAQPAEGTETRSGLAVNCSDWLAAVIAIDEKSNLFDEIC